MSTELFNNGEIGVRRFFGGDGRGVLQITPMSNDHFSIIDPDTARALSKIFLEFADAAKARKESKWVVYNADTNQDVTNVPISLEAATNFINDLVAEGFGNVQIKRA